MQIKKGNKSSGGGGSSPDLSNYYTKMETDALLYLKANVADVYSKNDIDTALAGKADVADLDNKQDRTEETLETTNKEIPNAINEVNSIAKGAQKGISYGDYETMITAFNALSSTVYNVGQSVYIVTLDVPDLWISDIESGNVPYTYIDDETFVNALKTDGYVQVGFYKLSALETGKVDLTEYYNKTETDDLLAPKLTEPSSNLAVGKWFRIASIDNNGHAVLECVDAPPSAAALTGTTAPTTSTVADYVGQTYINTTDNRMYKCVAINNGAYAWIEIIENNNLYNGSVQLNSIGIRSTSCRDLGVSIGINSSAGFGVAIGKGARANGDFSTALGWEANIVGKNYAVAVGAAANANAHYAIQLGGGTNSTANTFQVRTHRLLEADGTIPPERITSANWTDAQRLAVLQSLGCTVDENGFVKFTYQE